jgi:small subunit ribosomal protein S1
MAKAPSRGSDQQRPRRNQPAAGAPSKAKTGKGSDRDDEDSIEEAKRRKREEEEITTEAIL